MTGREERGPSRWNYEAQRRAALTPEHRAWLDRIHTPTDVQVVILSDGCVLPVLPRSSPERAVAMSEAAHGETGWTSRTVRREWRDDGFVYLDADGTELPQMGSCERHRPVLEVRT